MSIVTTIGRAHGVDALLLRAVGGNAMRNRPLPTQVPCTRSLVLFMSKRGLGFAKIVSWFAMCQWVPLRDPTRCDLMSPPNTFYVIG